MTRRKDSHEIIEWARRRGWVHADTNAMGHLVFERPGHDPVTTGSALPGRKMTQAHVKFRRAERLAAGSANGKEPCHVSTVTQPTTRKDELDPALVLPALAAHGVEVTVQDVTPAKAAYWLEHNDNNPRRLRVAVGKRYATDMTAGAWAFPSSFIGFAPDGDLVNGQHTCWAVVESGQTITTLVLYNVGPEAVAAMDRGLKRSLADTLTGNGVPRPRDVQSTVRALWAWENNHLIGRRVVPTDHQCLEWLEANPGVIDATLASVPVHRKARLKKSVIGPLYYRGSLIDPDAAGTFLDGLVSGAGLEKGSPILALRDYGSSRASTHTQVYDLAVAIKCWNAHVTGNRVYALRWLSNGPAAEDFPEMVNVDDQPCGFDGKPLKNGKRKDPTLV